MGTHCNIGSKRACYRRTRQVTQLFTYLLKQRRTERHAHIGSFTFASRICKTSTAAITEICIFVGLNPCAKIRNFLTVYACAHRFTSLFRKCSKSVQNKWPKVRVVLIKNTFGIRRWKPWNDFPYFCVSAHRDPWLIIQVSFRSDQVWGRYKRKTPLRPHRVNAI